MTPPRAPFVAGAGHLTMIRERATAGHITSTDVFNLLTTAENLRAFVEQIARGEIRHTCPAARALLGIPVVTIAIDDAMTDAERAALQDKIRERLAAATPDTDSRHIVVTSDTGAMIAPAPKGE